MRLPLFALLLCALSANSFAQQTEDVPSLDGYLTRVASANDFDANGFRVVVSPKTQFSRVILMNTVPSAKDLDLFLGAHVQIFGKVDHKKQSIQAKQILLLPPVSPLVKGAGLIDRLPALSSGSSEGKLVRADGYVILLNAETGITLRPPLTSLDEVGTNVWIAYKGEQRNDGVVVASTAVLSGNEVPAKEEKARTKADYDPAAVDPNAKQSAASKAFLGVDPKQVPPYRDDAIQARVSKIGDSLVPRFQRDLPDGDPTKLRFRFQVVDEPKWRDAVIGPLGVILVPKQVVERMENDSQLAAVLAGSIAALLEDGFYRLKSVKEKATAAQIAELAVGGLPAKLVTGKVASDAEKRIENQAARVSLCLMKDAGYNLAEAPKAWWILSTKEPKPLVDVKLPERVQYLYEQLGTTWRSQ